MKRNGQAVDAALGNMSTFGDSAVIDIGSFVQWFFGDGTSASAEWADRWWWLFLVPLLIGLLVSVAVLLSAPSQGQRYATLIAAQTTRGGRPKRNQDMSADLAARLTFLGAAVVAGAQLEIFKTDDVVETNDLGILLVVNIVFTAIAASHNLLADLPLPPKLKVRKHLKERLARGVLIWSAVGSLASVLVIVLRTSAEVTPGLVKFTFSLLLVSAAVMVCAYVRARLPGRPYGGSRND